LPLFLASKSPLVDPPAGTFAFPLRIASFVIGKPLWWALEQVGLVSDDGGSRHDIHKDTSWYGDYVLLGLVQNAAERVLERQEENLTGNKGDALYTFDAFRKEFGACVLSAQDPEQETSPYVLKDTDAKVLVKYLEREMGTLVVDKDVRSCITLTVHNTYTSPPRLLNSSMPLPHLKNAPSRPSTVVFSN